MESFKIKFKFKSIDTVEELPVIIKNNVGKYIQHRLEEFQSIDLAHPDLEAIKLFCHKTIGSATSYNLNQLDEITKELKRIVQDSDLDLLADHLLDMQEFLEKLTKKYYKA